MLTWIGKGNERSLFIKKSSKFSRRYKEDAFWGYLMVFPAFMLLSIFMIWPILQTIYLSFTESGWFNSYTWVGLDNYRNMFFDNDFWYAVKNTTIFTFLSVPLSIAISIMVSIMLNHKIRGVSIYRTLYFLPVITMSAATAIVWKWLLNGDYGLINQVLGMAGLKGQNWLTDTRFALYALIIVHIWSVLGNNIIILMAGLQGIPGTYYEAASIDGANFITIFKKITLPLLSPTVFFTAIILLIRTFQVFDIVYMMTGENSLVIKNTQTLIFKFFGDAFILHEIGYGSAIVMAVFIIIMFFTVIQFQLQKIWVHYE